MAATKRAAFSSNHDEDGLVDFDQILSDLCDLEHQLNEQSNLNDVTKVPDVLFEFSSPLPPPEQPSVIFKDYTRLMTTSSPSKAKPTTNGPSRSRDHHVKVTPAAVAGNDLDCALLELSSLIGPGFDFAGNVADPAAFVQGSSGASSDLRGAARGDRLHSNQLRKVANGANNNNGVHPRSKSMENCQRPQKMLPNSLLPQRGGDGFDRLSDGGGQNDSMFEDDVSIPSSGSRVSVATSSRSSRSSIANGGGGAGIPSENDESQRSRDASKTVLIKNNQSDPKKTFIQVYSPEGNCENTVITEEMKVWQVVNQLLTNSHALPSLSWSLVEQLPGLWMERLLEDSERLTEVIAAWTKDSENRILLAERADKYDAFVYPEKYMTPIEDKNKKCDDGVRQVLIQEFLDSNCRLPEFDGMLYIKLEGKKAWKKLYFILRSSGIYYNPKGKSKSLIDLVCLQRLDLVEVYTGIGWKKKYKAPTDFGFALKHPQIQKKAPKYIKYLCAEDVNSMWHWVNSIRLAKNGQQLHDAFQERRGHVDQFFGDEGSASRSKQTALMQEKISEMLSQQTDHPSVPSFYSATETMQTFRAESPEGSSRRRASAAAASQAAAAAGDGVDQKTRSPPAGRVAPMPKQKKPIAVSMSVNQLGPSPPPPHRAVSNDGVVVDSWDHPGFPLFPNNNDNNNDDSSREMLSGSVDQLQSVGSSFGRRQKTPAAVPGGGGGGGGGDGSGSGSGSGNGGARWATGQQHAVIKRTPSVGHRDVEIATAAVNLPRRPGPPTSPKPQPLPKPSFSPAAAAAAGASSPLRSSLPPVRRKFPSSTSFSDDDDAKIAPKPKPPLPPKRADLAKQSLSADSSPCHRALPQAGELPTRPPPPGFTRPSSRPASSAQSLSPPSSPPSSCETSWQNNSGFLVDLERVILQKRANGPAAAAAAAGGFEEEAADVAAKASPRRRDPDDPGDLPPPPPVALLAGLKGSNRPPLPPKRSNETKLSYK